MPRRERWSPAWPGPSSRPIPAGEQTFQRVVIGGQVKQRRDVYRPQARPGVPGHGQARQGARREEPPEPKEAELIEYTLRLPMRDAGFASFAAADQLSRDLLWDPGMLDIAESLFQVPPDQIRGVKTAAGRGARPPASSWIAFAPAGRRAALRAGRLRRPGSPIGREAPASAGPDRRWRTASARPRRPRPNRSRRPRSPEWPTWSDRKEAGREASPATCGKRSSASVPRSAAAHGRLAAAAVAGAGPLRRGRDRRRDRRRPGGHRRRARRCRRRSWSSTSTASAASAPRAASSPTTSATAAASPRKSTPASTSSAPRTT